LLILGLNSPTYSYSFYFCSYSYFFFSRCSYFFFKNSSFLFKNSSWFISLTFYCNKTFSSTCYF